MKKPNETFVFELPDFFVFYAKLKRFVFLCLIFTWHSIFKKTLLCQGLQSINNPTKFASLIDLFELGGVVHFGMPDWIRTSGLQSRSYQVVKPESLAVQRFDWYRTNFRHFEEKPQKPYRAGLPRFFAIVVK